MLNRKIFLLFIALFGFIWQDISAQNLNTQIKDPDLDYQVILVGKCNRDGLKEDVYGAYFNSQYELYVPAKKYTDKLKEKLNLVDIVVVFGTWCSDSKIQVPRFFKVLDASGNKDKNVTIIAVNRQKNALTMNTEYLDIKRVPTFIVFQDGKELGRIVETPKKSLEKDLLKIVNKAKIQNSK